MLLQGEFINLWPLTQQSVQMHTNLSLVNKQYIWFEEFYVENHVENSPKENDLSMLTINTTTRLIRRINFCFSSQIVYLKKRIMFSFRFFLKFIFAYQFLFCRQFRKYYFVVSSFSKVVIVFCTFFHVEVWR